jgi:hypothetical protein
MYFDLICLTYEGTVYHLIFYDYKVKQLGIDEVIHSQFYVLATWARTIVYIVKKL